MVQFHLYYIMKTASLMRSGSTLNYNIIIIEATCMHALSQCWHTMKFHIEYGHWTVNHIRWGQQYHHFSQFISGREVRGAQCIESIGYEIMGLYAVSFYVEVNLNIQCPVLWGSNIGDYTAQCSVYSMILSNNMRCMHALHTFSAWEQYPLCTIYTNVKKKALHVLLHLQGSAKCLL